MDEITLNVGGLPPAKGEAQSMFGAKHSHSPRVRVLLEAARSERIKQLFQPFTGYVGLEVEVWAPESALSDATNYLGGIGDVLQGNRVNADIAHLGDLAAERLYLDDRQIREVSYKYHPDGHAHYRVRVWRLRP